MHCIHCKVMFCKCTRQRGQARYNLTLTNFGTHGMDIVAYMRSLGAAARQASRVIARANTGTKNAALQAIHDELQRDRASVLAANERDVTAGQASGLDAALLDRLALDDARFDGMLEGLRQVIALADPIGEMTDLDRKSVV